jgi:hypothetical protein
MREIAVQTVLVHLQHKTSLERWSVSPQLKRAAFADLFLATGFSNRGWLLSS